MPTPWCLVCLAVSRLCGNLDTTVNDTLPIPKKIELLEDHGSLIIRRRWFGPKAFALAFFCLIWDGFLVIWYFAAFSKPDAPLMMKLFPLLHVGVGFLVTYIMLAHFINKTDIAISPMSLSVKHYPMKWFGGFTIDVTRIEQLFTNRIVNRSKNGNVSITYEVQIIDRSGRNRKLVGGLDSRDQGLFIEKKIEQVLGIEDQKIEGAEGG